MKSCQHCGAILSINRTPTKEDAMAQKIKNEVAQEMCFTVKELEGKDRHEKLTIARHICIALISALTNLGPEEIPPFLNKTRYMTKYALSKMDSIPQRYRTIYLQIKTKLEK